MTRSDRESLTQSVWHINNKKKDHFHKFTLFSSSRNAANCIPMGPVFKNSKWYFSQEMSVVQALLVGQALPAHHQALLLRLKYMVEDVEEHSWSANLQPQPLYMAGCIANRVFVFLHWLCFVTNELNCHVLDLKMYC